YGIDISYRAKIDGGVIIIHGYGLVIGEGATIDSGVIMYHQVTLGIKGTGENDGFPSIGSGCVLGAGAKLLGPLSVGKNTIIGANVVVTKDVPENVVVTNSAKIVTKER